MSEQAVLWCACAWACASCVCAWALSAAGLNGAGLVASFHLYLLPSAIFGGYVIGRTLCLPLWGKTILTCVCAASLASMLPYA